MSVLPEELFQPRQFETQIKIGAGLAKFSLEEMSWEDSTNFKKLVDKIDVVTYEKYMEFLAADDDGNLKFSIPEDEVEAECIRVRRNALIQAVKSSVKLDNDCQLTNDDWVRIPFRVLKELLLKQIELNGRSEILGELYGLLERVAENVRRTSSTTQEKLENEPN